MDHYLTYTKNVLDIYSFSGEGVRLSGHRFSCGFHAKPVRTGCSRAVPYGGTLSIVQMIGWLSLFALSWLWLKLASIVGMGWRNRVSVKGESAKGLLFIT